MERRHPHIITSNFMGGYYGADTEAWIAGNVGNDDYFLREQLRKEREEKKQKELDSIYHKKMILIPEELRMKWTT